MRIALINTPSLFAYGKISTGHNCSFPLGLGYLASYLIKSKHTVTLIDPEAAGMSSEQLWSCVKEFSPDLIGITAVTANFMLARQLIEQAKKKIGCQVIMGGCHATALPESSLRSAHPYLDAVIRGEGELPLLGLADSFDQCGSVNYHEVPGAAFLDNGAYISIPKSKLIPDIDVLPYPARELVDICSYRLHPHFQRGTRSATILSSRGCPSNCTFCANITMKRKFRPNSAQYFLGEVKHLMAAYGVNHFHIVDDCFTYDSDRLAMICQMMIDNNLKITWACFGRVDTLQEIELIKLMKRAGCVLVILGIESGNQHICDLMRKETTLQMAQTACNNLRIAGIDYFNSFIVGNEGETRETIFESIYFSRRLKSVMAAFNIMVPFPGTALFKKYYRDYDDPSTDWNNWCSVGDEIAYELRHTKLSKNELLQLTSKAYREFYMNPTQLLRILRYTRISMIMSFIKGGFGLFRQVFNWSSKSRMQ